MASQPTIIGISGGSGSGKTLFLKQLMEMFTAQPISLLSLDNYYRPIDQQPRDENNVENFDLPQSLDDQRFYQDLRKLKSGQDLELKEYTFNNTSKVPDTIYVPSSPVIVVEGIYTFYFKPVFEMLDLKIFIEAPEYLMLTRRISRDAKERGYDLDDVLYRFQHHVTPAFKKYIEPLKFEADLIIPNHNDFTMALNVVCAYLRQRLT